MTLPYGVIKAKVASMPRLVAKRLPRETQYHLRFGLDVGGQSWQVALNVGTNDSDDLLRYKLIYDFHHSVIKDLSALAVGPVELTGQSALPALDFLRSDILAGTGPWRVSDVMDGSEMPEPVASLMRLLGRAHDKTFPVYLYGRFFTDGQGIHDTHMNQGSNKGFVHRSGDDSNDHNDVWQDGALFVDVGEPEYAAYFAAFTNQLVPTDDLGNPLPDAGPINAG